ncbi:MAG: OsmC family protein [Pseudomonadota bacterium]|uniref:OsmC family protein n=1 Tax=Sphingomonas sp. ERG5 TaxID=1381597 RepID=UPI00054B2D71|nr:OsmC family protein [Sphingomonas sp. ERG5]
MSDLVSVHVTETGDSPFSVRIETGGHALVGDEPEAMGGADLGPSPYQLLAAALGECTAMTVRWFARQRHWPVDHVAVDVTHEKGAVEGRSGSVDIFRKTVMIRGDALTEEQHLRLLDVAAKCPVHRTLENGSSIVTLDGRTE